MRGCDKLILEVPPMADAIAQFADAKYLNLETFRKSGVGVRTPVWFAQEPGAPVFYIYSAPDAGKVKRIRNNPKVRVAPCTVRGQLRGAWVDGVARICSGDEAAHCQQLLRDRYGWLKIIGDFFSRMRGRTQTAIAIEIN
jgi:uncharacterized protein